MCFILVDLYYDRTTENWAVPSLSIKAQTSPDKKSSQKPRHHEQACLSFFSPFYTCPLLVICTFVFTLYSFDVDINIDTCSQQSTRVLFNVYSDTFIHRFGILFLFGWEKNKKRYTLSDVSDDDYDTGDCFVNTCRNYTRALNHV